MNGLRVLESRFVVAGRRLPQPVSDALTNHATRSADMPRTSTRPWRPTASGEPPQPVCFLWRLLARLFCSALPTCSALTPPPSSPLCRHTRHCPTRYCRLSRVFATPCPRRGQGRVFAAARIPPRLTLTHSLGPDARRQRRVRLGANLLRAALRPPRCGHSCCAQGPRPGLRTAAGTCILVLLHASVLTLFPPAPAPLSLHPQDSESVICRLQDFANRDFGCVRA